MACGNACREAYTAGGEAALLSLENTNVGAFVLVVAGAAPEAPPVARRDGPSGVAGTLQSRRWTAREPGRPGCVRAQSPLEGGGQRERSRPWPEAGPHQPRERESDSTNHAGAHGTERRNNEPKGCGAGSRSALILPSRAGSRGHRDPPEGSGASYGQNRRRQTREDIGL